LLSQFGMYTHRQNRPATASLIDQLQAERASIVELIAIAIVIALAVNLLANVIFQSLSQHWRILASGGFLTVAVIYLGVRRFGHLQTEFQSEGFLLYDAAKKAFIPVEDYELSREVCRFQKAAFAENKAYRQQWEQDPLENIHCDGTGRARDPAAAKLLRELLDYIVLSALSTHLTDYFGHDKFDTTRLKKYERSDIPETLLRNRYLELFSKPMEDRAVFGPGKDSPKGVIYSAYGTGGTIYERFELILPTESTVTGGAGAGVVIRTPLIEVSITPRFDGFCTVLPFDFVKHYVGVASPFDITEFLIRLEVRLRIRFRGIFSWRTWGYHRWAESFFEELRRIFDSDEFLNRINWDFLQGMLRVWGPPQGPLATKPK